ncbi:cobalt/nickel transport system permease protein [Natronincola peptidivorans]|uniref:Cobalt transport protein CbiM n=1 Tax=Natronincola peptidivorans TaxID=426128 RepID=A0A1I0CWI4_9FIRM|nr:energy-coupling factor ABC transporter permease [Natronincola peptidivorans]SET24208.1 cobalt/nickel transport system permease protein [Natronincola peptidivorans]
MKKKQLFSAFTLAGVLAILPTPVFAMHISEGFLSLKWVIAWWIALLPFLYFSTKRLKATLEEHPNCKILLAVIGATTFVLSTLTLPSFTGSSSHPAAVALGAIMFGPTMMVLIYFIVLTFHALLLSHGGITTLGANAFSMAVVGPFVTYGVYKLLKHLKAPTWASVFVATAIGSLSIYITTSIQLSFAYGDAATGFLGSFMKFMSIFAITQIPLAIVEGVLTVVVFKVIFNYNKQKLEELSFM